MFAPVGYRSLAELWREFLRSRLDAIYRASSNHYANKDFDSEAVRGTPLDVCEQLFLGVISTLNPVLASSDGRVFSINEDANDGGDNLFALVPPYQSAFYSAAQSFDQSDPDALLDLAGAFFEPWSGSPDQPDLWTTAYPCLEPGVETLPRAVEETLRFARLSVCFERDQFLVVERLPPWVQFLTVTRNSELIVSKFGGWSICIPDTQTRAWNDILSGKTHFLDDALGQRKVTGPGRTRIREVAADTYFELGLDNSPLSFRQKLDLVIEQLGFSLSESTLRRGLKEQCAQDSII